MPIVVLLPCSAGNSASSSPDTSNSSKAIVDVEGRYVDWQEDWAGGARWSILVTGNDVRRKNCNGDLE